MKKYKVKIPPDVSCVEIFLPNDQIITWFLDKGSLIDYKHVENISANPLIENLELSERVKNICREAKIVTLGDLVNTSFQELRKKAGCGITSIKEIKETVEKLGFKMREI